MKKVFCFLLCALLLASFAGCKKEPMEPLSDWATLQEAYLYAFPLVLTDATKTAATNTELPDHAGHAPVNQLIFSETLATAATRVVVTPNVDTLYTQAWLDVAKEPMIYRMPTSDRFFNVQVLDAWTNTVTVLKDPGNYAFVRNNWKGTLPDGVKKVEVPTDTVWLICRIVVDNEADIARVRNIQSAMRLVPLSAYDQMDSYSAPSGTHEEKNDFVPIQKVLAMTPQEFFQTANRLMKTNPPAEADTPCLSRFSALGIGPDLTFSAAAFSDELSIKWKEMLNNLRTLLAKDAQNYTVKLGDWSYYGDPIGNFGTAYTYRAMVALGGLGANTTDIAIYPKLNTDHAGENLTGKKQYILHLASVPPVLENGFWSFTVYGDNDFLIENSLGRYCINDRSACQYNEDGSLDILLSYEAPAENTENWLPIGEDSFHLFLRIYYPDMDALKDWTAPTLTQCTE